MDFYSSFFFLWARFWSNLLEYKDLAETQINLAETTENLAEMGNNLAQMNSKLAEMNQNLAKCKPSHQIVTSKSIVVCSYQKDRNIRLHPP